MLVTLYLVIALACKSPGSPALIVVSHTLSLGFIKKILSYITTATPCSSIPVFLLLLPCSRLACHSFVPQGVAYLIPNQ